jgi:hypothetical protein
MITHMCFAPPFCDMSCLSCCYIVHFYYLYMPPSSPFMFLSVEELKNDCEGGEDRGGGQDMKQKEKEKLFVF